MFSGKKVAFWILSITLIGGASWWGYKTYFAHAVPEVYVFFGPPACGKGTLASRLKNEKGFVPVSTGDMLRSHVSQNTELGKQAQLFMAQGKLVPDELVNAMVNDWLIKQSENNAPLILDGYPRTVKQAEALLAMTRNNFHLRVISFVVSEDEAVNRIVYRVVCSNKACQKVYSLKVLKPKVEGVCDICGSPLLKRSDDTQEVIRKRYNDYMQTENAMLAFFRDHGIEVNRISAEQPVEGVFEEFQKILKK